MAAAEEGCDAGVEADRELEELLESKSPWREGQRGRGRGPSAGLRELEIWGGAGESLQWLAGEVV